jgi:hypothetical protein
MIRLVLVLIWIDELLNYRWNDGDVGVMWA